MKLNNEKINKRKLIAVSIGIFSLVLCVVFLLDRFFDNWDLSFQPPVLFQPPIIFTKRRTVMLNPFVSHAKAQEPVKREPPDDPLKREIWDVFGEGNYDDAIKVFECESGLRPEAVGHNKNGSTDTGITQINSIHGIKGKWLKNPEIAIRVAKQLFDENGWTAWRSSYACHGVK